jgi:release factor glutamine methyltransferase
MGVGDRVRFELTSLPSDLAVDLLVANLPYVPAGDLAGLEPEVTEYEPVEALSPGPTGLEAIDALLSELVTAAVRPKAIGLEVGIGQAATVADLVRRAGYERIEIRPDLAGIDRVVAGWA